VTLCVDEDPRTTDLTKSPRAVVCFGLARLLHDEDAVRDATTKMESRYLPAEVRGPELDELLWFEGRVGVEITPERWLAWDQGRGSAGLYGSTVISTRSAGVARTSARPFFETTRRRSENRPTSSPNA
jgi:hypothetical protein